MSDAASIDGMSDLTPIERAAASGELPSWARATPQRRAHMTRVADLLEHWARDLGVQEAQALRWRATGMLHDVLRDADPDDLRNDMEPSERDLPGRALHGPAAANHLRGQVSPEVLTAIRYHTIGHPDLDELGRALYLADFLEPGRPQQADWRRRLRERMPTDRDEVLVEVLGARIRHLLDRRMPIRPETAAFWSVVAQESPE